MVIQNLMIALYLHQLWTRYSGLSGWLYEHCDGANRRVRERPTEEQVWWRLHKRQQRYVCHVYFNQTPICLPFLRSDCLLFGCSPIHQHVEAVPHRRSIGRVEHSHHHDVISRSLTRLLVVIWLVLPFSILYLLSAVLPADRDLSGTISIWCYLRF